MEVTQIPTENPKNQKRKLLRTVLDNFSKLTNPHEHVRLKNAANLLKHLAEYSINEEGTSEVKYALKRLLRGLGAPAPTARIGYYSTLVALLNLKLNIDVATILEFVKAELHKSGKNSDGENADICTGQILACGALIRGGSWLKANSNQKEEILQILLSASKERTYLGLLGCSFIIDLVTQMPEISDDNIFITRIKEEITKPWPEQTLDSLYLLLKIKQAFPKIFNRQFTRKFLETPDIVCDESLESLCNILMAIPRVTSLKHPIFDVIVTVLTPTTLGSFFSELDKHLKTPNRNRLLVFIKILSNTLTDGLKTDAHLNQIPLLFTRNFITQLLGYFRTFKGKQKDKEYYDATQKLFNTLLELFKNENVQSTIKISVIKRLLFDPGTFVLEKITKSKIIQQITLSLDTEGVKSLACVYRGVTDGTEAINTENDSEIWLNNDRLYSAHLLIKLLNLPTMKQEDTWKVEQLTFLMKISLLKERSGMNVGRELADSLKTAFFGALDLKLSKLEELHAILSKLVHYLEEKLDSDNLEHILRTPVSDQSYQLWKKTLQTVRKIEKKQKKSSLTSVFLTLFFHMGLQLFNEVKLATDSLNELFSCYDRVKKDKKIKQHTLDSTMIESDTVESESESDPVWIEVVVDLFLNLLSHNSHLLRSIIKSVFPHLCQYMTSTTIHQIISVLDPKNDENPLSKSETGDTDSEDENGDTDSGDESGDTDSGNDESDEKNSDDEEEDDEDQTATDKLRMALHQVLSNGGPETDNESIDLDEMSDTEGEKLDRALADAFKQYKPNHGRRKKQTKDQETLTHFRIRVLDLIEMYLDSTPTMILSLEIMLPLLQAVEFSIRDEYQKPLNDRLRAILKKLLGLKKFSDFEGVNESILVELLKSLLEKGSKNVLIVQEMGEQISDCCIFVVKCSEILRGFESTPAKMRKHLKNSILEVICGETYEFFTKRDCLTPYVFFKHLLQLSWEGNIDLTIILLDFMFNEKVRQYKKNQVAELLKIFYQNQRFLKQYETKIARKLMEPHGQFASNVINLFKELYEHPERKHVKEKFVCNMFNLLTAIKQSQIEQSNIPWSDLAETIREYRSYKSFSKDAKMSFNKLCRALGVSNIVAMKQQVTKLSPLIESENDENKKSITEKEPKKKHKRKSNETLKLKKEAKQLRLNTLSKGLGVVEFEDTNVEMEDHDISLERNELNVDEKIKKVKVKDGREHDGDTKKKRKISQRDNGLETENQVVEKIVNGDHDIDISPNKKSKKQKNNSISQGGDKDYINEVSVVKKRRFSEGAVSTKLK